MIEVYAMERGTGKTTKVIEMMENDPELYCMIPIKGIDKHYPPHLRNRMVSGEDFLRFKSFRGVRVKKLVLDEGFMYSKSKIAELYYTLGVMNIPVFSFGTD